MMVEAAAVSSTRILPEWATDCDKFVRRVFGGWGVVRKVYARPRDLVGARVRVVCADEESVILVDGAGRYWLVQHYVDCMYLGCTDVDDPYGGLEYYLLERER